MSNKILTIAFVLMAMSAVFMYASMANAQFVEDGLVSYWSFDDGSLKDAVGGHDGTLEGDAAGAAVVAGKLGDALKFDGTGTFVKMADPDAFICNKDFTWCAWIQTDAGGCIVSKTDGVLNSDAHGAKTFFVADDGTLSIDVGWVDGASGTVAVNDGDWHFVAMTVTFDGNDTIQFYADGEDAGQGAMDVNSLPEDDYAITIGWDPRCGLDEFPPFTGIIDDVSIYNRALSADEIKQDFDAKGYSAAVDATDKLAETWGEIKISR